MKTKLVLSVGLYDEEAKQKVLKSLASLKGVDSITSNVTGKKLTVVGDIDPVSIVSRLRKLCPTDVLSVGPAEEPEKKKEEPEIEESVAEKPKKEEPTKDEKKKGVVAEWDFIRNFKLSIELRAEKKEGVVAESDFIRNFEPCVEIQMEERNQEPEKEEPEKDEKKKDVVAEPTKLYQYQEPKKEEPEKDEKKKDVVAEPTKLYQYQAYNPYMQHYCNPYMQHYYVRSVEEDPNGCVIC